MTQLQHLRGVLGYLDMPTLNKPEAFIQHCKGMFAEDDPLAHPSKDCAQIWADAYLAHVARNARAGA
jgi:chromate reductase